MTIYLSLAVCLVGALVYGYAKNEKLVELGKLSFFAGLLAFLIVNGSPLFSVIRR